MNKEQAMKIKTLDDSLNRIIMTMIFIAPIPLFLTFLTWNFEFFPPMIYAFTITFLLAVLVACLALPTRFSSQYKEYLTFTQQNATKGMLR